MIDRQRGKQMAAEQLSRQERACGVYSNVLTTQQQQQQSKYRELGRGQWRRYALSSRR